MYEAIRTVMVLFFVTVLVSTCVAQMPQQEIPAIEVEAGK